jgi:uncharacterized membrane protein
MAIAPAPDRRPAATAPAAASAGSRGLAFATVAALLLYVGGLGLGASGAVEEASTESSAPSLARAAAVALGRRATSSVSSVDELNNTNSSNSTEAQEDEPIDDGSLAVAVLVLSGVGLVLGIVYLVNHNHDDIQHAAWHMLKDTIAIFTAVMWYQGMDTLLDSKMPPPEGGAAGEGMLRLAVGLAQWFVCYVCMQLLSFQVARFSQLWSMTCTYLGAPICGLAAKEWASTLQQMDLFRGNPKLSLLVVVITAVFGACVVLTMNNIRKYCLSNIAEAAQHRAECCEELIRSAENDMISLAVSFVTMQAISFIILGYLPPAEMKNSRHTQSQRFEMLGVTVSCAVLSFTLVKVRLTRGVGTFIDERVRRAADCMQTSSAMLMAWCCLYWGYWELCETRFAEQPTSGFVILAVAVSAFSGASIVLLDWIASRRAGLARTNVLKCAFVGFALVVAFSWEQTFDNALESISEEFLDLQPATSKLIAAGLVMLVSLPAFTWYILPKTLADDKHKEQCTDPVKEKDAAVEEPRTGPVIVTAFAV